jgi:enoyl-CoA hydratase
MPYKALALERKRHVAIVRLTPPTGQPGAGDALLAALERAAEAINDDAEVRVAILSAGRDASPRGEPYREREASHCLESIGQPVICALRGDVGGTAMELALASDVRVAAEDAALSFPGPAVAQRLARLVGRGEALRLLLLGESVDAAEALRIGLVSAVFPPEGLDAEAEALAGRMASRGPIALRYAKEAVRRGLELPLDEALRMETDLTVILQTTEDRAEGVHAFIEKRAPRFIGR